MPEQSLRDQHNSLVIPGLIINWPLAWSDRLANRAGASGLDHRAALQSLVTTLAAVDSFYDSIGGLLGYQLKCLQILQSEACSSPDSTR